MEGHILELEAARAFRSDDAAVNSIRSHPKVESSALGIRCNSMISTVSAFIRGTGENPIASLGGPKQSKSFISGAPK